MPARAVVADGSAWTVRQARHFCTSRRLVEGWALLCCTSAEGVSAALPNALRVMRKLARRRRTARGTGRSQTSSTSASVAEVPDVLDLFTRTTDGVMAVDPTCRIILWNSAAECMLGYAAEEVLGRACHEVMQGRDAAGNLFCHPNCAVITMARREEMAHAYDVTTHTKDGAERRLNVSTVLVPGHGGNIVVHLFRDAPVARQTRAVEAVVDPSGNDASPAKPSAEFAGQLTAREREILCLIARGEGTRAMARALFISTATVRNHTQSILTKLTVHSRLEAVALAFRRGILQEPLPKF
jgi:PAS domain S-box-containing protein